MSVMEVKRMGRPPKISREEILDAAARWNPADLQFTTLARELGISAKTIYYYFPARQALIDGLTQRAVEQIGYPDIGGATEWRQVLREDARWHYRAGTLRPRWFNDEEVPTAGLRKLGIDIFRLVCNKLSSFGWDPKDACRAHVIVSNWAVALGESIQGSVDATDVTEESFRKMLEDLADSDTADEMVRILFPVRLPEELFEDGLEVLFAGIGKTIVPRARASS